ncbi:MULTISPECIES: methyltransferase family protein [Aeromonas]|uniref:methyltransferase family protein n=1 Tax=Aeromonas TaxID=642 RepID=UPI0009276455|nr:MULTISPECIES: isoprenylcysteine carboxylmethyltransferase family protein [Aeromonas]OJW66680.1 MAG: isoprenylcysteine carboxyl methyltransferase [Aeromonas sp. 62-46]
MKLTLRIPPLLLFVVIVLAMWLGRGEGRAAPLWLVLVATLWLVGALLGGGALLHFWQQRTTVHPQRLENSRVLVTRGVYRISRNPMYLGLLCWTLALACYLEGMAVWLGPLLLWGWLTRFQILAEEQALRRQFGDAYDDYCRQVRRWC